MVRFVAESIPDVSLIADLYQVPKAQVQVLELQVQVQVPRSQVQVPITPDQVQPKYWSKDSGTQIGRLVKFYCTETVRVLSR